MSKKVLITSRSFGKINDEPFRILHESGIEWIQLGTDFSQERFEEIIPEFDGLIIGAHPFPPEVMARCGNLEIICKHGAGLDNIHLEAAAKLGITVCNAPGTNSNAVADLAFGLMLDLARKITQADRQVRQHEWKTIIGVDVCYKTLGLLGFGAVGKCVASRAHGFGMKVLVYDPFIKEIPDEYAAFTTLCDRDTVIQNADFLSLHLPLTPDTLNLITSKELASMKKGSFLINTARGGIVNEMDLYNAVKSGHLGGTAMDVSVQEPMTLDNPLRTLDNVIVTPHIGMYSMEAINAVSVICAENIAACLTGNKVKFQVV